ncbi:MAG: hypothetical protein KIT59_09990 [Nitrosomonas sp.]|nr:hypothetical protein [Nitrosomonas sp.]
MSEYKYVSWYSRMHEECGGNKAEYVDRCLNMSADDFVAHQIGEVLKFWESTSDYDYRWDMLLGAANSARDALKEGNKDKIAMSFCFLGEAIEQLQQLHPDHLIKVLTEYLKMSEVKRGQIRPLDLKNDFTQHMKALAQTYAYRLFRENKELKLDEVTEAVHAFAKQKLASYRKEKINAGYKKIVDSEFTMKTIEKWVYEVAIDVSPKYIKKRGRPKNNNSRTIN